METHQTKWKIHIKPTDQSRNKGKLFRVKKKGNWHSPLKKNTWPRRGRKALGRSQAGAPTYTAPRTGKTWIFVFVKRTIVCECYPRVRCLYFFHLLGSHSSNVQKEKRRTSLLQTTRKLRCDFWLRFFIIYSYRLFWNKLDFFHWVHISFCQNAF